MKNNKILIVGTGALATLFAAKLSAIGVDITMLGSWLEGLSALKEKGATLVGIDGGEKSYPVRVVSDAADCVGADFALVLVKSWQTERTASQLGKCLSPDALAVTLQNGLGNGEILSKILGRERVAQGVTTTGASLLAPGVARAGGEGKISIETHPRLGPLSAILTEAGFNLAVVPSAVSLIWSKLVINAAINPLTALLNIPNGELLLRPTARALMGNLADEAASVAEVQNIPLSFDNPVAAAEDVAERTSSNISSMLQDLRRGAPTEIDAICGAVTRIGKKYSIPTPLNQLCWQLVQARTEVPNHGKIQENHNY